MTKPLYVSQDFISH